MLVVANGANGANGTWMRVVATEAELFLANFAGQGSLDRLEVSSGVLKPIVQQQAVTSLAVDADWVYWGDGGGELWRAKHDGSAQASLATAQGPIGQIAVDSTRVD